MPRLSVDLDIFDVMKMLEKFGWNSSFVDCFVAYLAGRNTHLPDALTAAHRDFLLSLVRAEPATHVE
jgi:hypothetical protein